MMDREEKDIKESIRNIKLYNYLALMTVALNTPMIWLS